MNDISRIVDEMCAWLEAAEARFVPTLPTSAEGRGNAQVYDIAGNSHTSRSPHTQNEASVKNDYAPPRNATISAEASRVTSSYAGDVGSVGSVGHILYIYIYNYINIVGLLMYWDIVYVFGFIEAFFFGDAGEMLGGTPTGLLSELAGPEGGDSIPFQVKVRVR